MNHEHDANEMRANEMRPGETPSDATRRNETLLTDYALGELSDGERAEVERRLAVDDEARHELEELGQLAGMLRTSTLSMAALGMADGRDEPHVDELAESVAVVAADRDLHAAVLERLNEGASETDEPTGPKTERRRRLPADVARRRSAVWAVAASIGVLVTGFGAMALMDQGRISERPAAVAQRNASGASAVVNGERDELSMLESRFDRIVPGESNGREMTFERSDGEAAGRFMAGSGPMPGGAAGEKGDYGTLRGDRDGTSRYRGEFTDSRVADSVPALPAPTTLGLTLEGVEGQPGAPGDRFGRVAPDGGQPTTGRMVRTNQTTLEAGAGHGAPPPTVPGPVIHSPTPAPGVANKTGAGVLHLSGANSHPAPIDAYMQQPSGGSVATSSAPAGATPFGSDGSTVKGPAVSDSGTTYSVERLKDAQSRLKTYADQAAGNQASGADVNRARGPAAPSLAEALLPKMLQHEEALSRFGPNHPESKVVEQELRTLTEQYEAKPAGDVAELSKLSEGRELERLKNVKQETLEKKLKPLLAEREKIVSTKSSVTELKELEQKVVSVSKELDDLDRLQDAEVRRLRQWKESEEQRQAQFNTDAYDPITENPFVRTADAPLSTFSIDVDTASYSIVRKMLTDGVRPPRDSVRLEEFVNYFTYDYPQPEGDDPFSVNTEAARCPWNAEHVLVRVGLKGKEIHRKERPATNLVFLVDVSGSMNEPNKLPLVRESLKKLTDELGDSDRVAIVVYAGNTGLVLDSTGGYRKQIIKDAIDRMQAGGSTNGGAGLELAYRVAGANFIKGGVNRVILATDGDFNVGVTNQGDLVQMIEAKAKTGVFFTALGYGMGNLKDSTLEKLADKGNGNYAYIDTLKEAQKVLVEQMSGTLVTIAKDVKIQIEFNPQRVAGYRLLGYENRILAAQDFNDDKKDAGEIGAGHTVTALYELIPVGKEAKQETAKLPAVDPLKYQQPQAAMKPTAAAKSDELLTLKLRYKQPDGERSKLIERPVKDDVADYAQASGDFKFAASVASFGMVLRRSAHRGSATFDAALELALEGVGKDEAGYRREFVDLIRRAKEVVK